MKTKHTWFICVLIGIALLTACGQPPTPTPNVNVPKIEFTTNPPVLKVGDAELIVTVKDKDGKPVDDAEVNISYSMTTMNMGNTSGKATDEGGGRYTIKTSFGHTGNVKFTIQVDKPGLPQGILETKLDVQ